VTKATEHWAAQVSTLRAQVAKLLGIRQIDDGIQAMIRDNPEIGQESYFWPVYHEMYATIITTGLRRIIFPSGSAVCLVRLLGAIAKSSARPSAISPAQVAEDVSQLVALGTIIKRHVDENIAHIAFAPTGPRPRWRDLSDALDLCAAVTLKYSNLLTSERFDSLAPRMPDDWRMIFRTPWVREAAGA